MQFFPHRKMRAKTSTKRDLPAQTIHYTAIIRVATQTQTKVDVGKLNAFFMGDIAVLTCILWFLCIYIFFVLYLEISTKLATKLANLSLSTGL